MIRERVKMSADRLAELIAQNQDDLAHAKATGQRKWVETLKGRVQSLMEIRARLDQQEAGDQG